MSLPARHTAWIKTEAARLGFDYCGIARAEALDEDARRLEQWLQRGMQGQMQYMENYFDLRTDPRRLVPGAQSVITLLLNYFPAEEQREGAPRVSRYAYGEDYHQVIKRKLKELLARINEEIGEVHGRGFVDSAPVLERSWAVRSGLGWVGRNGNLLTRKGSYFFIATLITDLPLAYDDPFAADYCGSCRRCIDACPTEALSDDKVVDGSRCISYFTIELKAALIPEEMEGQLEDRLFGCDICQEVCPWNRFSSPHREPAFTPLPEILNFTTRNWEALTEEAFREIFRRSPLKRAGYAGIRRNLEFLAR